MRPKTELSKEDEQYVQDVMTELKRLRRTPEEAERLSELNTAMNSPIQRSDNMSYLQTGDPVKYPNESPPPWPWVQTVTSPTPPIKRTRSFTETYNMGLNITHEAVKVFEEETGQTMSQLSMAQLAVKIAQMLENW